MLNNHSNYPLVIIPLIMWCIAQFLKFLIYSLKHGINWRYLFEYGHMPSAHTATVTALIYTTGYYEGVFSPIFAIAFIVGAIIIFDAVKLRNYIGEYGKVLNKMQDKNLKIHLKEHVGHTLTEVISGGILGILGALILIELFNVYLH